MKELSIEQKAKLYDDAKARMSRAFNTNRCTISFMNEIFPELKKSEDENIREKLKHYLEVRMCQTYDDDEYLNCNHFITWLENQGKKESDPRYKCLEDLLTADDIHQMSMNEAMVEEAKSKAKNALSKIGISELLGLEKQHTDPEIKKREDGEDKRISKEITQFLKQNNAWNREWLNWLEKQGVQSVEPNWCHHKVDLSDCSEEYRKAYYDGWNNCNMQHSQCGAESNDIVKCLINGMRFYYDDNKEAYWGTDKFGMKVKDILYWLEKQVEQKPTNKAVPKFKVGDWIVDDETPNDVFCVIEVLEEIYKVIDIDGDDYHIPHCKADNQFHLWTIQDAMNGDVLVNWNNTTFIFKAIEDKTVKFHIAYNEKLNTIKTPLTKLSHQGLAEPQFEFHPATKEQCDTFFVKMKEAGYEWDADKKELKTIKVTSKDSDDEMIRKAILLFFELQDDNTTYSFVSKKDILTWLQKQGEQKTGDYNAALNILNE